MSRATSPVKSFWQYSVGQMLTLTTLISLIATMIVYANREQLQFAAMRRVETLAAERNMALYKAVTEQNSARVIQLLKLGADPNTSYKGPGASGLEMTRILEVAIRNGDIEVSQILLKAGAVVVHSALEIVIDSTFSVNKKLELMRILMENGAEINESVMRVAVQNPTSEIIDLLRLAGAEYGPREMASLGRIDELRSALEADPNILNKRLQPVFACLPDQEPTLLGIALMRGHEELSNWLIDIGAKVSALEEFGNTLMFMAARGDCAKIIERLRNLGCDPNAIDKYGDTPLMACCSRSHPETILALIRAGAKVNVQNYSKSTPLHHALWRRQEVEEVVTILLDAGADPFLLDSDGKSARDCALLKFPSLQNLFELSIDENGFSTR